MERSGEGEGGWGGVSISSRDGGVRKKGKVSRLHRFLVLLFFPLWMVVAADQTQ